MATAIDCNTAREDFWRAHYGALADADEFIAAGRVCYGPEELDALAADTLVALQARSTDSLLDVGAAKGALSRRFRERVRRCVALDWISGFRPDVVADARALPFAAGAFDLAVLSGVLMLLSPAGMRAALEELFRVTRRAALLAANPFCDVHVMAAIFTPEELTALATGCGWREAEAHPSGAGTDQAQYYFDLVLRH